MISLTSPIETRAHGWPAGLKLGALCVATVGLFAVRDVGWHLAFAVGMLSLYALPGAAFFRSGVTKLRVLWMFVLMIVADAKLARTRDAQTGVAHFDPVHGVGH